MIAGEKKMRIIWCGLLIALLGTSTKATDGMYSTEAIINDVGIKPLIWCHTSKRSHAVIESDGQIRHFRARRKALYIVSDHRDDPDPPVQHDYALWRIDDHKGYPEGVLLGTSSFTPQLNREPEYVWELGERPWEVYSIRFSDGDPTWFIFYSNKKIRSKGLPDEGKVGIFSTEDIGWCEWD